MLTTIFSHLILLFSFLSFALLVTYIYIGNVNEIIIPFSQFYLVSKPHHPSPPPPDITTQHHHHTTAPPPQPSLRQGPKALASFLSQAAPQPPKAFKALADTHQAAPQLPGYLPGHAASRLLFLPFLGLPS